MCRVIHNPKYSLYNLGDNHPFSPLRIEMVIDLLKEWKLFAEPVLSEPIDPEILKTIHEESYVDAVEQASTEINTNNLEVYGLGTADNPIFEQMALAARYQVGGTHLGARLLIEDKANKVLHLGGGFHHAHHKLAAGFCIYNDLSMAIKEMINSDWHVAYIDIDVHHGDGVQEMFYSNSNVLNISIHESGEFLFPGKGWIHELGSGSGRALNLNVPLEPFSEGDSYIEALEKVVKPALSWFKPNAIIVQAGADAHYSDPLADNLLTTHDYEKIFKKILGYTDLWCNGKALFTLGGGYSITATPRIWTLLYLIINNINIPDHLPDVWRQKWSKILNKNLPTNLHDKLPAFNQIERKKEILNSNRDVMQRLMDAVAPHWL